MNSNIDIDLNKIIAELININFEKIYKKFGQTTNKFKIAFNTAFKKYIKNAHERYSKVKTFLNKMEPEELYKIYQPNTLQHGRKKINPININNILDISKYLIIKGTAGIGKTTLFKHFFINSLVRNDLIPVFIELKNLSKDDCDLYSCIYDSLGIFGFNLEKESFEYALKTGCFLFLLDGCDEIASIRYEYALNEISSFCDRYNNNYYIISSRPNDSLNSLEKFTVLESLPFTKTQAISLIRKLDYDVSTKKRFIESLRQNLYEKHKSFASNPLLLNIMLITYDDYAEIPEKLHIFYEHAFLSLFSKHDATKNGFKREILSKLSYDSFKEVFARFCFLTYIKNKLAFQYDELIDNLKDVLKGIDFSFDISSYINDLKDAVCVLYLDGITYAFSHRSFQEYFTAVYLKDCLSDQKQTKVCLYLIENKDFIYDKVFDMFRDMAREKVERNIFIPIFKELNENFDIKHDRYYNYFSKLVGRIGIRKEAGIVTTSFGLPDIRTHAFVSHYIIVHDNNSIFTSIYDETEINQKILDILESEGLLLESDSLSLNCAKILDIPEIFELLKDTWVGKIIIRAIELSDELLKKQDLINNELDKLLDNTIPDSAINIFE